MKRVTTFLVLLNYCKKVTIVTIISEVEEKC